MTTAPTSLGGNAGGDPARADLDARVLQWIGEWRAALAAAPIPAPCGPAAPLVPGGPGEPSAPGRPGGPGGTGGTSAATEADDARFDALARELFGFQLARCAPWARYCAARGVTPERVTSWREIPPVPAAAFKELPLRSFPVERERHVFRTSGTSGERRGELHLDTLALYEASVVPSFVAYVLPELAARVLAPSPQHAGTGATQAPEDGARAPRIAPHFAAPSSARSAPRLALRVLAPVPDDVPDSSLSHMFGVLRRVLAPALDAAASGFDVRAGALELEPLLAALERATRDGVAVALCGTAFAFVHLIDACAARGARLALPPGSRVFETGGFKGRSRTLPRAALYAAIEHALGVPPARIVNQYGMTELASQFHDSVLRFPGTPRRKLGPPWARVRIVDPLTAADVPPGDVGAIAIVDLASTGSVCAIQTADLGRALGDGFEVLGRAEGAEARGCSIAADEMLSGDARG